MNRHIKKIITIALCMSMMQPALQATPFGEFCRKWVARGAAVGYWGILGNQVLDTREQYLNTIELRDNLNAESILDESSLFPTLKDYVPQKAAQIDAVSQKEGMSGLKGYNVKVLTNRGIQRFASEAELKLNMSPLSKNSKKKVVQDLQLQVDTLVNLQQHGSPAHVGDATIVIPESCVDQLDVPTLAATLAHEEEHAVQKHVEEKVALKSAAPFAIHASCKGIYNALFGASKNTPTITRSLLRIPRASAIVGASYLVRQMHSRECERQADKALQKSPLLSRSLAHTMDQHNDKGNLDEALAKNWDAINQGAENIININGTLDKSLATNMTKAQYIAFMGNAIGMLNSHPWTSERAEYLRKWAQEAEAKKQQE